MFLCIFALCGSVPAQALSTAAAASILVDCDSGRVLYAQNEHEKRPIASITKLMTALLVAEHSPDLGQVVTVPYEATLQIGSSMYLKAGEQVTVEELLFGLMLASGNDAAVTLAIHLCGSTENFVTDMNARGAEIGMKNTYFASPNGLNDEENYSTAHDMALLARVCAENEIVAAVVGTKSVSFGTRSFVNHNKLLWRYQGCIGMKTGYTDKAGRTLVSCARRDARRLIAVTLHDPNDWVDHAKLLDYGFAQYQTVQLSRSGKLCRSLPVGGSILPSVLVATDKTMFYPLAASEVITARWKLPQSVPSPISLGQKLGTLTYYLGETVIGQTDLVAATEVPDNRGPSRSLLQNMLKIFRK
ncbi:MAG: D-alanyl-D-alanine carboxypeptidase family protein [Oscillospiraceae bacterium]